MWHHNLKKTLGAIQLYKRNKKIRDKKRKEIKKL